MDRPRQVQRTLLQRSTLIRTGIYALIGTAVAVAFGLPTVEYFAQELDPLTLRKIAQRDVAYLLFQGSSFVFAYLWLAFYMLEHSGQPGGLVSTNGSVR